MPLVAEAYRSPVAFETARLVRIEQQDKRLQRLPIRRLGFGQCRVNRNTRPFRAGRDRIAHPVSGARQPAYPAAQHDVAGLRRLGQCR